MSRVAWARRGLAPVRRAAQWLGNDLQCVEMHSNGAAMPCNVMRRKGEVWPSIVERGLSIVRLGLDGNGKVLHWDAQWRSRARYVKQRRSMDRHRSGKVTNSDAMAELR